MASTDNQLGRNNPAVKATPERVKRKIGEIPSFSYSPKTNATQQAHGAWSVSSFSSLHVLHPWEKKCVQQNLGTHTLFVLIK